MCAEARGRAPNAATPGSRCRTRGASSSWRRAPAADPPPPPRRPAAPRRLPGRTRCAVAAAAVPPAVPVLPTAAGASSTTRCATNWYPRPRTVLMKRCDSPSSPSARRAALIRLVRAASPTNRPAPYRVEQLFLGDAALVVAYQLGQDVEHLRFDTNHLVTVTQFVALGVEDESIEAPQAGGPLSPAVGRLGRPHQSVAQFAKLRVLGALRRLPSRRLLRHISPGRRGRTAARPPRRSERRNPGPTWCP